jgi:apolipoprotein N-acyltransferase
MGPIPRDALAWLFAAALVSTVANGAHAVALAAWLAPFLWLRALHRLTPRTGAVLGGVGYAAATVVAARGMLPVPGELYVLSAVAIGLGALSPYVVHRRLAPRLPPPLYPLLLPTLATAFEFLSGQLSPFGSFGAVAYTQVGFLPLLQLVALWGLPGITFLLYLPAAVGQWILDVRPPRRQGVLLGAVLGGGLARLHAASAQLDGPKVSVAIVSSPEHRRVSTLLAPAYATGDPSTVDWPSTFRQGKVAIDDLLRRSQAAAQAGAQIIVWPETAAIVSEADEPALRRTAGALARSHQVYLALALGVIRLPTAAGPARHGTDAHAIDNRMILLGPGGDVVAQYRKTIAVPGPEAALLVPGDGRIPIVDTPYGRVALAICFDLDFPQQLRQAAGADLLLVAAEDWPGITPYHSDMARLRAIEGGFALVRAARYGRSLLADAGGRLLATAEHAALVDATEGRLLAQLPLGGRSTIYARWGDILGWLSVAALVLLVGAALAKSRAHSARPRGGSPETEHPNNVGNHRESSS